MRARRAAARLARRISNWPYMPYWGNTALRIVAHLLHPHVLRCRLCGAEFVAVSGRTPVHAARAYKHFADVHENGESNG